MVNTAIVGFVGLAVGSLCAFHTEMISTNTTTIEFLRGEKIICVFSVALRCSDHVW